MRPALEGTFAALSDSTRIAVVQLLCKEPRRASEIAEALEMTPAAMSRHLRTLRKQRGMSQQALADEADISWPTVQRVEAGSQSATLEVLAALALALGLRLCELVDFTAADHA